jgi:hypothetical protein
MGEFQLLRTIYLDAPRVDIRSMNFHPRLGTLDPGEAKFGVKAMGVLRCQHPPAQALQIRMAYDTLHQPPGEPSAAVGRNNENIGQISEGCAIRDDAGKTDLLLAEINAEGNGVFHRPSNRFRGNSFCPVGIGQELMHHAQVDPRRIGADLVVTFCPQVVHQRSLISDPW